MNKRRLSPCAIAILLLLSACTKTIYQEVPAATALDSDVSKTPVIGLQNDDPTAVTSVPGNSAAVDAANSATPATTTTVPDPSAAVNTTPATGNTAITPATNTLNGNQGAVTTPAGADTAVTTPTAGANTAQINATIANVVGTTDVSIHAPEVIGAPGEIVDCALLLPCRWVSTAQDFTLTVGNVDNTGTLDRLSIVYSINASHDTELLLGNGSTALAPGGESFNLIQQTLGTGNGIAPQAVSAGANIIGSVTYDRSATGSTLAGWTLTVVDNGLPRTVGFINLPIGTPNAVSANCAGVLPCQWTSQLADATITLVAVGGYSANGRLNVNFNLQTTRNMNVVLDAGTTAFGTNGEIFEGRTHGWGVQSGFAAEKTDITSGVMLPGNVSFFRTSKAPASLNSLDLIVYEDSPTPRWNP